MADQTNPQAVPNASLTNKHLERVTDLLTGLKEDARQAESEGDVFMLGVYNELVGVVSPIVVRASARLVRQEKAEINKAHRNLRKQLRAATSQEPAVAP